MVKRKCLLSDARYITNELNVHFIGTGLLGHSLQTKKELRVHNDWPTEEDKKKLEEREGKKPTETWKEVLKSVLCQVTNSGVNTTRHSIVLSNNQSSISM